MARVKKDYVERVINSSVGKLVSIEEKDNLWHCRILVPRNIEGRLNFLKRTFPNIQVRREAPDQALCLIPIERDSSATDAVLATLPPDWLRADASSSLTFRVEDSGEHRLSVDEQARQLSSLYETMFEMPCHYERLEKRLKFRFPVPMTYPFQHPFTALLPRFLPEYTPVAVHGERHGDRTNTSLYLADRSEHLNYAPMFLAVHIDAAFRDGVGAYGIRYMTANQPAGYLTGIINCKDSTSAELAGLLYAMAHLHIEARQVVIYTDSEYVIGWTQGEGQAWMRRAVARHKDIHLRQIGRDRNKAAHSLASKLLRRWFDT